MADKAFPAIGFTLLAIGCAVPASAQDAAETAAILSGTGQGTGSASRSMGSAVSGSLNRASQAVQAANGAGQAPRGGGRERGQIRVRMGYAVTTGPDALEGTDAPTYQMGNGASIRVSGKLRQPGETTCSENCPEPAPAAEGER